MATSTKAVALEMQRPPPRIPNRHPKATPASTSDLEPNPKSAKRKYTPWFTYTTAVACLSVFVWQIYLNGWQFEPMNVNPLFGPSQAALLAAGAKRTDLIVGKGEWYR